MLLGCASQMCCPVLVGGGFEYLKTHAKAHDEVELLLVLSTVLFDCSVVLYMHSA